ncbi:SpoIIE family protein phosphatase [Phytohabitans houttuyneae]|uniref:histidine kinase n=1 Tax=Phytohabitans houttuyneae TaxID=1076126 RepID=A0A6V8KR14_9ACTN|nr:SpoIIE family protein phosphatase [Phytohabitans houttuyneae]GFJ84237.1 histidine kinase [Phytohabitans houttuyneae]
MPVAGLGVFSADPEVGRDLAAVDWAATPLGPPESWPQSLRTAVSILLSSRFSMWMAWGPELTFFCNAAYRRDTLARKYPWALGRPAREVWAEIWPDIGPRIDTVLSAGQATWDEALLLFLERSGYPEETYHTFSYSPLRDDGGVPVGMLCVVSEDTKRVIGERRLATLRDLGSDPSAVRTERELLESASHQLGRNRRDLPFTLTYLYQDGVARLAATTGIPAGHPAAPATLPLDSAAEVWPSAALAKGETVLVELDRPPFTGLPAGDLPGPPERALVVPLAQQGGGPNGFLVTALNRYRPLDDGYRAFIELVAGHLAAEISSARSYQAQQRRAEELAELDRAKTAFFSNISHEFRTPLTLIMGPVEELRGRLAGADQGVRDELEVIHRSGLRLGKLVNTLLDFSRIEAGRMQARFEPVDLAAVTAELASVFRSAVERAGLVLAVDCPPLDRPVYLDLAMWEKVVLNLLSNALKFTFEGTIGVSVRAGDREAVVTVADTGTGVAADQLPRLFERFHRVENARSRSNEGSGIGLALVQELVTLHGGTITADSVEGRGTRFSIRLPYGHAHLPEESVAAAAGTTAVSATADPYVQEALRWLPDGEDGGPGSEVVTRAGEGTLVVADDNADMREYLTRLLTTAGYQVVAVADGQQALEAVRASAPDLLVSDVMMPNRDGLSLVGALRADHRTAAVPVLLLSARAGQEASIEGLQAGADDYLVKPFAAAELLARVRANVQLARLRNHHARWRTALVDSMQEAFFVCDERGAVVEINAAFTEILGYGPEDLPYEPVHPWWPDAAADPEARRRVERAFATMLAEAEGSGTVPVTHRDGHRLWVSATFNRVRDPDTRQGVVVGTFRDVTADHYAIQRESALAALSVRLSGAATLDEALSGALEELRELWSAAGVSAVVFRAGSVPALTAVAGRAAEWGDLAEADRAALVALRDGPTLTAATLDGDAAGIALEHPDGTLVLRLDLGPSRPFSGDDLLLLSLLAGHLAQGLARAQQIDQQRETAIALQRSILGPSTLPPGFAVRYEPAARPLEVGGDWYDIIPLTDGRIGIVVGDCVGRGLAAAAVMGQLRSACRALLLQDHSPARTLMTMDHFAAGVPGAACTTVFCGVLDPATGHLTYASAGHPPGILALADGSPLLLDGGRSLPLAVRPGRARGQAEHAVPARATMLLYTDGLIERRRRPLTDGIHLAASAVRDGADGGLAELATGIMSRLVTGDGYDDDVAVLLYRRPGPVDLTFSAEPGQLAPVRGVLRQWLEQCDVSALTAQNVLVAAGEACANAIEHGHRHAPGGPIRVRAEAYARRLHLAVADSGEWKTPAPEPDAYRGRGLKLMRAMMDRVAIDASPGGTTVDMEVRIAG